MAQSQAAWPDTAPREGERRGRAPALAGRAIPYGTEKVVLAVSAALW